MKNSSLSCRSAETHVGRDNMPPRDFHAKGSVRAQNGGRGLRGSVVNVNCEL